MDTASGFYLRYLLDSFRLLDLDLADSLRDMHLDEARLALPDSRIGLADLDRLVCEAEAQNAEKGPGDAPLSLKVGGAVTPGALDVLAYASMSSHTLGEAIDLMCQFEPYRLGWGRGEVVLEDTLARVRLHADGDWPSLPCQVEAALAGWMTFGRWISASHARPVRVCFRHPATGCSSAHEQFFSCPVAFGAEHNEIQLDRSLLSHALPSTNPDVCRMMSSALTLRVSRHIRGAGVLNRLEQAIVLRLESGPPSLDQVAADLLCTPKQLRKQLTELETTFSATVDGVRRRLAEHHLAAGLPLLDVSQKLGYSEQSAFSRAHVRWFGVSPGRRRAMRALEP